MDLALTEMGISVLSGAITTFGSGIFLVFCLIIMFNKFGIIICATIVLSIAHALIFFPAVNYIIGPQGNVGSLKPLFKLCCRKKK